VAGMLIFALKRLYWGFPTLGHVKPMTTFTPWAGLAGGALIGLAASLLLCLSGRIAGVSGIFGGLWYSSPGDRTWRLLFLFGLIVGAALWQATSGQVVSERTSFRFEALIVAGLAVGYGTSLSGGCTSGHGVCGLARFSLRSVGATLIFLSSAIATTYLFRHVLHLG
jgi:uncharacterized membrane protein YedE/YeeE